MKAITLIGKTGAGKTAVGRLLAEHYEIEHISSGDIARQMASRDEGVHLSLQAGLLAPEDEMRAQIRQAIERATLNSGGYVLEGFPRTLAQLILLMTWTDANSHYFHLDLDDYDAVTRLISRDRKDDNPDAIARKLEGFREETLPLIRFLDDANQLHTVNAAMKLGRVVDTITSLIISEEVRANTSN